MLSPWHRQAANAAPPFNKVVQGSGDGSPDPILTNVSSGTPNQTDATITWTSNVATNSAVFWGLTQAYGGASSPVTSAVYETSHSIQITGLTANTTYNYRVLSRRPTGAYAYSANATFQTAP